MKGNRAIAVVLLVGSLFVIGTLSASMGETVTSTPDDVIDVDTDSLPFLGDGASQIADSYRQAEEGNPQEMPSGEPAESGDDRGSQPDTNGQPQRPDSADRNDDRERSGGAGVEPGQQNAQGSGGWTDSAGSLLEDLLGALLVLAALVAIVLLAIVVARHREEILAWLSAFAERYGLVPTTGRTDDVTVPDGDGTPDNAVERAWARMVADSGADPERSDTPRECASAAIAAGADREPVEELTGMYERVRYGDRPVTPEDADRARDRLHSITAGASGTPAATGSVAADGGGDRS